jgi:hypothetical protein
MVFFDQKRPFFQCPIQGSESVVSKPKKRIQRLSGTVLTPFGLIGIGKMKTAGVQRETIFSPAEKIAPNHFAPSPDDRICRARP